MVARRRLRARGAAAAAQRLAGGGWSDPQALLSASQVVLERVHTREREREKEQRELDEEEEEEEEEEEGDDDEDKVGECHGKSVRTGGAQGLGPSDQPRAAPLASVRATTTGFSVSAAVAPSRVNPACTPSPDARAAGWPMAWQADLPGIHPVLLGSSAGFDFRWFHFFATALPRVRQRDFILIQA